MLLLVGRVRAYEACITIATSSLAQLALSEEKAAELACRLRELDAPTDCVLRNDSSEGVVVRRALGGTDKSEAKPRLRVIESWADRL